VVSNGASRPQHRKRSKAAPPPAPPEEPAVHEAGDGDAADALAEPLADLSVKNGPSNFRIHAHMQLLLAFDFVGPNEPVAVQRPWLAIVRQLPAKLYRPRYGT